MADDPTRDADVERSQEERGLAPAPVVSEAPEAPDVPRVHRRAFLAGAGAAAVVVAGKILGSADPAGAADSDPLLLGQNNTSTRTTTLDRSAAGPNPGSAFRILTDSGPASLMKGPDAPVLQVERSGGSGPSNAVLPAAIVGRNFGGLGDLGVAGYSPIGIGVLGTTTLVAGLTGNAGVYGRSRSDPGVIGHSALGVGVLGTTHRTGDPGATLVAGVIGTAPQHPGALGLSDTGPGVLGVTDGLPVTTAPTMTSVAGVIGMGRRAAGVLGDSERGPGVRGTSLLGAGVHAANLGGGLALRVDGRARFSSSGTGVVPAGSDSQFVPYSDPLGAATQVLVTLISDADAAVLEWVELSPGAGFTVHLAAPAPRNIRFTFVVFG